MSIHKRRISLPMTAVLLAVLMLPTRTLSLPAFANKIGMQFVRINQGTFDMGSPSSEPGRRWDERQHRVILTRGFYISTTEVTQKQWTTVMGSNPSFFNECGGDCPVETVSYNDCLSFIQTLNTLEKTNTYRLPTEAEWEYACRAGSNKAFSTGPIQGLQCELEPNLDKIGWYCGNSGTREPVVHNLGPKSVGLKKPNAWGLYDMHGNVHEWVVDACKPRGLLHTGTNNHTYDKDKITDPLSVKGPNRIFRGGSWNTNSRLCRSASRASFKPMAKRNYIGFRVVKTR